MHNKKKTPINTAYTFSANRCPWIRQIEDIYYTVNKPKNVLL